VAALFFDGGRPVGRLALTWGQCYGIYIYIQLQRQSCKNWRWSCNLRS
jgi:hypothetical protein